MTLNMNTAPALATALIEMRSESLKSVSMMTDIRVANLSVWLRGKEQVISEKRVVSLLDYLGVVAGELAVDRIHHWNLGNNLDQLNNLLGQLVTQDERNKCVVCCESNPFSQVRYLGIWKATNWTWVRLMLQAGLTFKPNANASILGFGHEYILPLDLTSLPVDEPGLVQATILNAIANLNNGEDVLLTPATKTSLGRKHERDA